MRGIIVAYDLDGGIGDGERMPWGVRDQLDDMKRFRTLTIGGDDIDPDDPDEQNAVIMGSKTFFSLPESHRPLSHRKTIVLTRRALRDTVQIEGVTWVQSLPEAYAEAGHNDAWVIGGGQLYEQALPTVNRVLATRVLKAGSGALVTFPELDIENEWDIYSEEEHPSDSRNTYPYIFSTYIRKHPIKE